MALLHGFDDPPWPGQREKVICEYYATRVEANSVQVLSCVQWLRRNRSSKEEK